MASARIDTYTVQLRDHSGGRLLLPLLASVGIAILVRVPALAAGFPVVDGGLFHAMILDIQAARFALPLTTSYNGGALPFAYPPLALYAGALLDALGPWTALDVLRWLPLALNLLAIPAFYRLARLLLGRGRDADFAVFAFVLLPESFRWFIMGGGLTRSAGFLFALLTLSELVLLLRGPGRRHVVLTGIFGGLTLLSHPQMAWFALISAVVFLLLGPGRAALGRTRAGLLRCAAAGAIALLVSAPWWLTVIARFGPGTLAAAASHGWAAYSGLVKLFLTGGTAEPLMPLLLGSAILGLVACRSCRWLGAWALAVFALDSWLPELGAAVPVALLAGTGLGTGLDILGSSAGAARPVRYVRAAILVYATFAGLLFAVNALPALSPGEQAAMGWAAENTEPGSRFLVISGDRWGDDRSAEWFPALSGRISANTVQGYEWAGGSQFARRVDASQALRRCAAQETACLDQWLQKWDQAATFVYVAKRGIMDAAGRRAAWPADPEDCCRVLRGSLARDPRYAVRFDNEAATIYKRVGP